MINHFLVLFTKKIAIGIDDRNQGSPSPDSHYLLGRLAALVEPIEGSLASPIRVSIHRKLSSLF